ncbi:hypothetical protein RCO27_11935 [Sphingosinicella sp. LHD-64]|uniref:hypothetical protein n=1 Tax=Sphingosinicella sp. LHD-64 TaxID=3072139 RepID=UPI00280FB3E4|nr:hypothetical protein [Sphingosinicella sp. LHD-64]MDQ8756937.1 hypothetical protein [Sphingosinicella sp. LHD-64]
MSPRFCLASLLLLASCSREPAQAPAAAQNEARQNVALEQPPEANQVAEALLDPPAPGEPGGLPDDRTPVDEGPFAETSAQGAANVLQSYFALIEQRRYGEARRLWSDDGRASGKSETDFASGFERYREYHANIGGPGEIEGAAGSLYVEVPVQVYGRLRDGAPFNASGTAMLRRVNDVPGSTAEQRRWHISQISVEPR